MLSSTEQDISDAKESAPRKKEDEDKTLQGIKVEKGN
jgi:hypothetical protein